MRTDPNEIIVQARMTAFRREAEREALARTARAARSPRDSVATRLLGRLHPTARLVALDRPVGPPTVGRTDRTSAQARSAAAGTAD